LGLVGCPKAQRADSFVHRELPFAVWRKMGEKPERRLAKSVGFYGRNHFAMAFLIAGSCLLRGHQALAQT